MARWTPCTLDLSKEVDAACFLAEAGSFEQALRHFDRALALDPQEVCVMRT